MFAPAPGQGARREKRFFRFKGSAAPQGVPGKSAAKRPPGAAQGHGGRPAAEGAFLQPPGAAGALSRLREKKPLLDERGGKGYTLPMRYYPVFLNLSEARCLVVGAGAVGRRKIATLLACRPAEVLVLDPNLDEEAMKTLAQDDEDGALRQERRTFRPEDAENRTLVFAATPSAEVNSAIADACRAAGAWCNVAGPRRKGAEGNVLVPASLQEGPLSLALSTGGSSPALARALKEDLRHWLHGGYAALALLLKALRPRLLALGLGSDADADIFRALCARPVRDHLMDALSRRDADALEELLRPLLPASLSFSAKEFFHGLD